MASLVLLFCNITIATILVFGQPVIAAGAAPNEVQASAKTAIEGHTSPWLEQLKHLAERHDPESLYRLGTIAFEGKLVQKDLGLAASLFERAAGKGHPAGQNAYGFMLQHGLGVQQDEHAAAAWYERAAAAGDLEAQNNLAWLYQEGRGVERNLDEAVAWYTRTAGAGSSIAS